MATVRMPTRQRRWPVYLIGGLVALAVLFTVMSTFYVDLLWFREVELTGVFWKELQTKLLLGIVFALLFFALLYVNLVVSRRIAPPPLRFLSPEQEAVERVRMAFEPYLGWLLPLGAAALALLVGIGVSRQWQVFLLWSNSSGVVFDERGISIRSRRGVLRLLVALAEVPAGMAVLLARRASRSSPRSRTSSGAASVRRRAPGPNGWCRQHERISRCCSG